MSIESTSRGGVSVALRASHADRDRVVDVLRTAAGDGRLTMDELGERVEAALTARTVKELDLLTADLPVSGGGAPGAHDVARIEQRGASTLRGGGWMVPRQLEIDSEWGDVTLDLADAVITHDTLRIRLDMRGGTLKLLTRPGIVVDTDALTLQFAESKARPGDGSGVPVVLRVEIQGRLGFGRVVVRQRRRRIRRAPTP
ncbi:DUF1707 domain-containing protein [Streptomyces sp. NPDC057403]|uniref:DUF1707 SHOCT-like domain-containing protein n=1 Tax=Streptomyces sp. NPDC057403 TaxID=3346119 RepID=UPI003675154D